MTKRLALFLVALLVLVFAAAGCGDDEDEGGSGGNTPAETASSEADTGSADESGNDGGAPKAQVKDAVERCKQNISAQSQLSAGVRNDLKEICDEAAAGDEDGVRKASKQVCKRIVEETAPPGAARQQAVAACEQAGATP